MTAETAETPGTTTAETADQSVPECDLPKYECLTQSLSRRTLLKRTAATAGAAAVASTAGTGIAAASAAGRASGGCEINQDAASGAVEPTLNGGTVSLGNFDTLGHPPRSAYRSLAETERRFSGVLAQNGQNESAAGTNNSSGGGSQGRPKPQFDRVVNAVDDLGVDPTGQESAVGPLESGAEDGTLILLPKGCKLLLDRDLMFDVSGTFGMVGVGYDEAKKPPGENGARFVAPEDTQVKISTGPVRSGLFGYFLMDMSSRLSSIGLFAEAETFCFTRDIRHVGVQDNTGSEQAQKENFPSCTPIAHNQDAAVRVQRFYSQTSGIAGMKNKGGSPGFWVGRRNKGLVELVQCQSMNKADNGIYGSRTPGDLHIIDGVYINNAVSQIRFAGKGSWAKGVSMLIDVEKFNGPKPQQFNNKGISINGVKTEMPSHINKTGGGFLENTEIICRTARKMGYPIAIRGHGGALTVDNCRIVNQLETPSLQAEAPGSSYDPKSPPPYDISVKNSTFEGILSNPVITIRDRPASSVTNTCLKMDGASPSAIQGRASTKNNTFGLECKDTGTKGPIGSAVSMAQGAYNAAAGFVTDVVQGLFKGAAVIATMPIIVLIVVGILAVIFSSSILAAMAFAGGAIKFFSKHDE